jgi:TPP-dependent pyruvate/acetoin dehydrogenase alpha subunit
VAQHDPLDRLRTRVLHEGLLTSGDIAALEAEYCERIEAAVCEVKAARTLSPELAFSDLFS